MKKLNENLAFYPKTSAFSEIIKLRYPNLAELTFILFEIILTHFFPLVSSCNSWNNNFGMVPGGIEGDQRHDR